METLASLNLKPLFVKVQIKTDQHENNVCFALFNADLNGVFTVTSVKIIYFKNNIMVAHSVYDKDLNLDNDAATDNGCWL